jgi:hypothetical protein
MAVPDKFDADRRIAVRPEGPIQGCAQVVNIRAVASEPLSRRGGLPICRCLGQSINKVPRMSAPQVRLVRVSGERQKPKSLPERVFNTHKLRNDLIIRV